MITPTGFKRCFCVAALTFDLPVEPKHAKISIKCFITLLATEDFIP